MIPNVVKGSDVRGLMRYLVGPGRANEHTHPHVAAGDPFLAAWHGTEELDLTAAEAIAAYLDEPHRLFGTEIRTQVTRQHPETGEREPVRDEHGRPVYRDQHVWHCSLSLPPAEGPLSAEQWEAICADFADAMKLTDVDGKAPCRWVAVHHGASKNGNDHVHLVATMVREDGTRWEGVFRDWLHAQQACRQLEVSHGLGVVDGRDRGTASRGTRPVELATAERAGRPRPARAELADRVRACAVSSRSEAEWLRRIRAAGVVVKPRFAAGTTDVVVGYRAALKVEGHRLDFYGGGQIARDLTLPRLREGWDEPGVDAAAVAAAEWQAAFHGTATGVKGREAQVPATGAGRTVASRLQQSTDGLASIPLSDREAWAEVARDTSGALSAWSGLDPANRAQLQHAAAVVARTAQVQRGGTTRRAPSTTGVAALLLASGTRRDRGRLAGEVLLAQLIRTAAALAAYHRATGSLREAERLHNEVVQQLTQLYPAQPVRADRDAGRTVPAQEAGRAVPGRDRRRHERPRGQDRPRRRTDPLPGKLPDRPAAGQPTADPRWQDATWANRSGRDDDRGGR